MITITISGLPRSGKTAVAHAIMRELERLQARVAVEDDSRNEVAERQAQKVVATKRPQVSIKVVGANAADIGMHAGRYL